MPEEVKHCSHKFVDSDRCLKCGVPELQLLRQDRAELLRILSETDADRLRARRAWATDILYREGLNGEAGAALDDYLDASNAGHIPDDVKRLVRRFAAHPLGACQSCSKFAVLFSDTLECVWGCTPSTEPQPAPVTGPIVEIPGELAEMLIESGQCVERLEPEDTEALIEQLDEALCSLLHNGDEVGEHSPRAHLDLFYASTRCPECGMAVQHKLQCSRRGAPLPARDVQPVSDETLRHLSECAQAWEPEARLLGNVTALELRAFCAELAKLRADVPTPEERRVVEASLAFPEHFLGSSATLVSGHHRQHAEQLSWAWEQAVLRLHEARRAVKEGV